MNGIGTPGDRRLIAELRGEFPKILRTVPSRVIRLVSSNVSSDKDVGRIFFDRRNEARRVNFLGWLEVVSFGVLFMRAIYLFVIK